ncbi:ATP-binding protein [Natroniella sulfidigena]|uniref:AAA family ATPase n=1 Tax=Natroniella sulfidigena TaxID=723921 RepID=UPI00200A4CE7|nr:AAA family ATPase [Natroniella sulfidigena]MCK8817614.1 ATP-binding protein [Natroniella sulfidigena]
MKKKLPIGINDFKEIREDNYYYVDKSLLIKEVIDEDAKVILLPRPRRFGKSLNISMLHYFFEKRQDNSNLFKGLKIEKLDSNYLKKMGNHPVIKIDFKGSKSKDWNLALERIKRAIADEYQRHSYLLDSDVLLEHQREEFQTIMSLKANQTAYEFALENLSKHLNAYYERRVIILIDEYDEPIQSAHLNGYYEEIIDFMRSLLIRGLKGNPNLEKGIMTGILRVAKESIFSGLNNLVVSSLLENRYDKYFGLLEAEVEEIFNHYGLDYELTEVKEWYNGYYFGEQIVYNPWSIISCVHKRGELKPYWINTSGNELVRDLIIEGDSEVKSKLELLIKGETIKKKIDENIVFSDIDKKSNALWSFLLLSGYLRAKNQFRENARLYCDLDIPNREVQYIYEEIIIDWLEERITSYKLEFMLEALTTGDVDTFAEIFEEFVLNSMSNFDVGGDAPEKVYHAFVLGLLLNLRDDYEVNSNRESGYERYDVMIIPKDTNKLGIVIEFKKVNKHRNEDLEEAVEEALEQIEARRYRQGLIKKGIDNVLELGIAFSGKRVKIKSMQ